MTSAFDIDRGRLSGLHFAKEALTKNERETLALAEAMLHRIDAVLELCDNYDLIESSQILDALELTDSED